MIKDEIKTKVQELVETAWDTGYANGANDTSETYMKLMTDRQAAIDAAYDKGFKEGHAAALKDANLTNPTEDEVEPTAAVKKYQVENPTVLKYLASKYYDGYSQGNGASLLRPYFGDIVESTEVTSPTELPSKDLPTELHNAAPGSKVKVIQEGKAVELQAVGQVRMIALGRIPNARDIGGWPCNGGKLSYGRIIRAAGVLNGEPFGDSLDKLAGTSQEVTELRRLGVTAEIDLRATAARYTPWQGVSYYGTTYNAKKAKTADKYWIYGYSTILTKPGNLKNVLTVLTNVWAKGGGVFVHCYAGADRTGTLVAILQMLCGCSEDSIIKEWEMTSFCGWCNFKLIDYERTGSSFPQGEMRTFIREVSKLKGSTLQAKIEGWLTSKVGCSTTLLANLKKYLIK